jgi:hypothetical protein
MEADSSLEPQRCFPWLYAPAVLLPFVAIGGLWLADVFHRPRVTMGPAMALACFMGPNCAMVVIWGVWRLQRGEGQTYPTLRWLVWLPAGIGVLARNRLLHATATAGVLGSLTHTLHACPTFAMSIHENCEFRRPAVRALTP